MARDKGQVQGIRKGKVEERLVNCGGEETSARFKEREVSRRSELRIAGGKGQGARVRLSISKKKNS